MEFRPKPMPIVHSKRVPLAKLRRTRVFRNDLFYVAKNGGQQLRRWLISVAGGVSPGQPIHLIHKPVKLQRKKRVRVELPAVYCHRERPPYRLNALPRLSLIHISGDVMMVANFSPAQPAEKGFGAVRIDPGARAVELSLIHI